MTYDELEREFEKTCESQLCCNDCKFHDDNAACALVYGYEKGRAEAIDETIKELKPRLKWENDIYKLAISHCIEMLEIMKIRSRRNDKSI